MGGGRRYHYPKYVWSPAGGWWADPKNWKRNTMFASALLVGLVAVTASTSWQKERRPIAPASHIPSQRFAKFAKTDDPSLP
ncbi:unnamed protein product [Chrysoparadoxa australica]